MIQRRPLGDTCLEVSVLGAGHMPSSVLDDREAWRVVDGARGYGDSEERLDRYLQGRREQVVISNKVGYDVEGERDWTAAYNHGVCTAILGTSTPDDLQGAAECGPRAPPCGAPPLGGGLRAVRRRLAWRRVTV